MIKVLLADDHRLFREGVRNLLELEIDIEVVGEAENGIQVQEMVRKLQPNVVLMDINMPIVDGVSAARQILQDSPDTAVIILTMYREDTHVFQAINCGARGYLLKTAAASEVVTAIKRVYKGESLIDPLITTKVLKEFQRLSTMAGPETGFGSLSEKETRLLRLIVAGLSNKEIANQLYLSESTVKNNLSMLFEKLDVRDRTQAAIYAITHGLVPEPDANREE